MRSPRRLVFIWTHRWEDRVGWESVCVCVGEDLAWIPQNYWDIFSEEVGWFWVSSWRQISSFKSNREGNFILGDLRFREEQSSRTDLYLIKKCVVFFRGPGDFFDGMFEGTQCEWTHSWLKYHWRQHIDDQKVWSTNGATEIKGQIGYKLHPDF